MARIRQFRSDPAQSPLATYLRDINETALLSEAALAADWNRPEEDAAWSHLQQAP